MSQLNHAQKQIIAFNGKHLIVSAGPGTGKTRALAARIVRLAKTLDYGRKVLAITFTNKAADELKARIMLKTDIGDHVEVGTFHHVCLMILRLFIERVPAPSGFRVANHSDVEEIAKTLWMGLRVAERKALLKRISKAKSDLSSEIFPEWEMYDEALRSREFLDYDDLLREAVQLLSNHPDVCEKVQDMFPYICVDEYQDINSIQHQLLKLVVGQTGEVTVVGDPNQAIYGFRGAKIDFFQSFIGDFPGATPMTLSINYRSAVNLVDAAKQIIEAGNKFPMAELIPDDFARGRIMVHEALTDKSEAEYVAQKIEKLVGGAGIFSSESDEADIGEFGFGDIAVVYRMNDLRPCIEKAFQRVGIPYGVAGLTRAEEDPYNIAGDQVSLMTLHAAKGLEFNVVFIVGCEDNLIPMGLSGFDVDAEEERRLFYVGVTRAKRVLYLSSAKKRSLLGEIQSAYPSSFIDDIDEELKLVEVARSAKPQSDKLNQLELF